MISAAHCGSRLYTCAADADVLSLSLDLSQMHSSQVGWYGHTGLLYTHPLPLYPPLSLYPSHFYYKSLCSAWVSSTVILAYSSPTASFPVHYGPIDLPLSLSWLTCFSSGWLNEGRCPGGRPSVSYDKTSFFLSLAAPDLEEKLAVHVQKAWGLSFLALCHLPKLDTCKWYESLLDPSMELSRLANLLNQAYGNSSSRFIIP